MRVMYCVVVMGLVFLTFNPLFWLARVLINCFKFVKRSLRNLFISFFIFYFYYFLCYETLFMKVMYCVLLLWDFIYESHVLCVVVMGLVFLTFFFGLQGLFLLF